MICASFLLSINCARYSLAPTLSAGVNFLFIHVGHHLLSLSAIVCCTQFLSRMTFHASPLVIALPGLTLLLFTVLVLCVVPMLTSSSSFILVPFAKTPLYLIAACLLVARTSVMV